MRTLAGNFFVISGSSGGNYGTFDMQDCVWYRFKIRAGFVKPSLFQQCDVSNIQGVRLDLSFLVSIGFHL